MAVLRPCVWSGLHIGLYIDVRGIILPARCGSVVSWRRHMDESRNRANETSDNLNAWLRLLDVFLVDGVQVVLH